MLLFADTEFTALTADAQLLSIALVSENAPTDFLYREVSGVPAAACSDFTLQHVLPHLQGGEHAKEFQRVALDVWHWIAQRSLQQGVEIAIDWDGDWVWLRLLLDVAYQYGAPAEWPSNLSKQARNISLAINTPPIKQISAHWMQSNGLVAHHALHDALRNRMAYLHFCSTVTTNS